MTSTIRRVRMRLFVTSLVVVLASLARPACAQDAPPPIPWVVVDVHATVPKFSSDDPDLAASRGMVLGELPGAGLGGQLGLHLYPLHTKVVTFGVGGEIAIGHSKNTPLTGALAPDNVTPLRPAEEKFVSLSPQLSLNFGNGSGWSYLSVGLGQSTLYLAPDGAPSYQRNDDKLKTFNYGGGARWFVKPRLAFSFDVRFYVISPGFADIYPATPRQRLIVIGAGISLK
jgi:hypothetical protein